MKESHKCIVQLKGLIDLPNPLEVGAIFKNLLIAKWPIATNSQGKEFLVLSCHWLLFFRFDILLNNSIEVKEVSSLT